MVAPALFATACAGPYSTLEPGGPSAGGVAVLWWVMLAGAGGICALVAVLLVMAFLREGDGRPGSAKLWLGAMGVGFSSAVLAPLLVYAFVVGERTLPTPAPGTVTVEAEGRQWAWRFRQPDAGGGTIQTERALHIPAGVPVDVHITTIDVIHSFWVPQLAGKMDAIPGRTNVLRIEASSPGTYQGVCAEFCGIGHTDNRFEVVAHDAASWAAFQAGALAPSLPQTVPGAAQ